MLFCTRSFRCCGASLLSFQELILLAVLQDETQQLDSVAYQFIGVLEWIDLVDINIQISIGVSSGFDLQYLTARGDRIICEFDRYAIVKPVDSLGKGTDYQKYRSHKGPFFDFPEYS